MNRSLFLLLFGSLLGVLGWRYYERTENPTVGSRIDAVADQTRDAAVKAPQAAASQAGGAVKPVVSGIKERLAQTGGVVRSEARTLGERMDDARIITLIKGKYVVDHDLSVFAISVECRDGQVKLTGTVTAEEYINRAVTLAREIHGVQQVESQLVVKN